MQQRSPSGGDGGTAWDGRRALTAALAWMLLAQLGCVVLWDAGWFSRTAALLHWLVVGVLPPALALWRSGPPRT